MDFKTAMRRVEKGEKVRREGHPSYVLYIYKDFNDNKVYRQNKNGRNLCRIDWNKDVLGTDWGVIKVDKQKKSTKKVTKVKKVRKTKKAA